MLDVGVGVTTSGEVEPRAHHPEPSRTATGQGDEPGGTAPYVP